MSAQAATRGDHALAGAVPDEAGNFGAHGGRFAPEALMSALDELDREYRSARADPAFGAQLDGLLRGYAGRPTLVTEAPRVAAPAGGCPARPTPGGTES